MTAPLYALTDTWNNGATVFTAILMNVTDTASAAGSSLLDLQIASSSIFRVDKAGYFVLNGDAFLAREAANIFAQRNGANAQTFRVYNTYTDASNYERGVFDWSTTSNVLRIGTENAGTGSARTVRFISGGLECANVISGGISVFISGGHHYQIQTDTSGNLSFFDLEAGQTPFSLNNFGGSVGIKNGVPLFWGTTSTSVPGDVSLYEVASKVLGVGTGLTTLGGWLQWGGQARVSSDVNSNNTTTLAIATGLTAALQAGRTYHFDVYLSFTCTAAQGIRAAMVGTGGLTATAIEYDGWIVDSAANGIKGNAQATALGTVVANAATTGTAGVVRIKGTITVNVAGNLEVQFAQSVAAANNTTVKRGSAYLTYDMP